MHKHTATNNNTILFVIAIVRGEFTMLIQQKYGFKCCVFLFDFYSAHYKVYFYLPCINTQRQTTASFEITNVISSSNRQTPRLYQTCFNPICLVCHHSLVCSKICFQIVGIGPICVKEIYFLFFDQTDHIVPVFIVRYQYYKIHL